MRIALLAATCLLWSPLLMSLAQHVDARAEAVGHALGTLQRIDDDEQSWALPEDPQSVIEESLHAEDPVDELGDTTAPDKAKARVTRQGAQPAVRRRQASQSSTPQSEYPVPKRGLRVRTPRVLELAKARVTPEGSYVSSAAGRPGGMRLSGVERFGVGLRDGDVLSHVQGVPATSRGAVVSAVMQARAARAPAVSAIFWRDGEPWRLVVEMPYLPERTRSATTATSDKRDGVSQRANSARVAQQGPS